jgi:transcriptional regulator with XRE-family HTH domain
MTSSPPSREPATLRQLLNDALARSGWTLREVERRSEGRLGRDTLSRIRSGRTRHVRPDTLQALHEVLRIPLTRLRAANGQAARVPPEPFMLPARANGLTARERALVLAVVDGLLAARRA